MLREGRQIFRDSDPSIVDIDNAQVSLKSRIVCSKKSIIQTDIERIPLMGFASRPLEVIVIPLGKGRVRLESCTLQPVRWERKHVATKKGKEV